MSQKRSVVGILGGGQLARMLVLSAHRLGIQCKIMSSSKNDPAAQVTSEWTKGDIKSLDDVKKFSRDVDIITFESEFAGTDILEFLAKEKKTKIHPSPSIMMKLQDRLTQKELLDQFQIPTSPHGKIEELSELKTVFQEKPLVFKARRDGYDGKGTFILKKMKDNNFVEFFQKQKAGLIWEEFVPFKRELAISLARSKAGNTVFFPLVESYQHEYRCLWVKGPVEHPKLSALKRKLKNMVEEIDYRGVIAFELFDDGKNLLVNEVAPRVHNSAHYSQDGLTDDQFSLHLKCILGEELKAPKAVKAGFAMYNLIGSTTSDPKWSNLTDCQLHWYGKDKNYPGRKMGHLNTIGSSPGQALNKLIKARKEIKL